MKLNKIFAFSLAALALTACSDDKSYNSASDVTVSMGLASINAPEDYVGQASFCYVPIKLSGKANGPVKVTVAVEEGSVPAIETAHYFITSKTVIIPEGQTEVNVEFYPTGDDEINDDRQFTMFIESVEGAKVEGLDRTEITLLDDDHFLPEAYAKIQGDFTFTCTNNDKAETQTWTISGVEESEEGYLKTIYISGLQNYPWMVLPTILTYDAASGQAQLAVNYGTLLAEGVEFNGLGAMDVVLGSVSGNSLVSSGTVIISASEDYSEINFPSDAVWLGALYSPSGGFSGYTWFWYEGMKLTRR